jgi:Tol biopolymer transport system component
MRIPSLRRTAGVIVIALLGTTTVLVAPPTGASTDGRERIVFSRSRIDGSGAAVRTVDPNGADGRAVHLPSVPEDFNRSTWSHDGRRLLHSNIPVNARGTGKLVGFRPATSAPDGSRFRLLALPKLPTDMYCSAWTPTDRRILCSIGFKDPGLFSLRASDGGGRRRLTRNPFGSPDLAVGFSPDGTRIAFLRFRPGSGPHAEGQEKVALVVASPDGSHARRITGYHLLQAHELAWADWSPDGRRLVSSTPKGALVLVSAESGNVTPVHLQVGRRAFATLPTFSPDGKQLLFSLFRRGPADLYRARLDGSRVRAVTSSPKNDINADWSVVPGS